MTQKINLILLSLLAIALCAIALLIDPIPQPQNYHQFADQRKFFFIPNAINVLSNVFFALAGIWGLSILLNGKVKFIEHNEKWPWIAVSIGFILVSIGSSYYHLSPTNSTLVWDRLALIILFMSFLTAIISEHISADIGLILFPFLIFAGLFSVIYWYYTEQYSLGDLRIYFGLQIFTILAVLVLLLTPSHYNKNKDIIFVVFLFGLAHFFEMHDLEIDNLTDNIISGHTLKHMTAAFAGFWLIYMISKQSKIVQRYK